MRDSEFLPVTEAELAATHKSFLLYGAELPDTLCAGILGLAAVSRVDHAIFITDLEGQALSDFQKNLKKYNAPSWLTVLSVFDA